MAAVEIEDRGHVRILRINRPEARNALNPAVLDGIGFGIEAADAAPDIRAIILTGTGDRAFCAGMDLRGVAAGTDQNAERDPRGMELFMRFRQGGSEKPVIGAVNATALAGGLELLLSCDVVIASAEARFGLPEVKRGLFPAGGGLFLGRRIPVAIASELVLTGDMIDAARAYEIGLVNRVVPPDEVMTAALEMAERIAANGPLGVRASKRVMYAALTRTEEEARALQEELQPTVFGSEDAREGATAFFERRDPVWRGR